MNRVVLIGRLGANPETKQKDDTEICSFSLATKFSGRDEPHWHNVVTYGKVAKTCGEYLSKGRRVAVEGYLNPGSYTKKDGSKVRSFEVVGQSVEFLDKNPA